MVKDIVVTGTGIISALGLNRDETLEALLNQRSGIAPVCYLQTSRKDYPAGEVKLSNEEMMHILNITDATPITRSSLMGIIAAKEAIMQASLRKENDIRIALISGITVGGMDMSEKYYTDFMSGNTHSAYIATHECGACTEAIADYFNIFTHVETISTACSSAANAIMKGAELIRDNRADIVVAGGSECLTKFHLNGFSALMILDRQPCRPFDANRGGLNLGEGAAYLVLEAKETGAKRKATPICLLSGYANACDAHHQTASSPNGLGAQLSMSQALAKAGLSPSDIDYINAHGTGTGNNDLSEGIAIEEIFRNHIPPVSSTKSSTGHTTSAAGSIEAVISILALQNGFIPANLNLTQPMSEISFSPPTEIKRTPLKHILTNSFGFGGNDTTLIFSALNFSQSDSLLEIKPNSAGNATPSHQDAPPPPPVYILDAKQISIQKPLCDEWIDAPILHEGHYPKVSDPDYKQFLPANLSRRLGKLQKRAILTSRKVMEATSIPCPDAILAGTSFGCVENTELFLEAMTYEGEECLKPTSFMQSTHNTIASMIAIETQCHGYNSTYTNKGTSFDCALADAFLRLQSKFISNALVGGYDELTPHYYNMLSRIGYIGETSGTLCGESAVSMMLTVNNNEKRALCRLNAIEMYYGSNIEELRQALQRLLQASNCRLNNIDAVMTGINGNPLNDKTYNEVCQALFPNTHILIYKNIFGEIRTSSALGLYAAAKCISQHKIPPFMSLAGNTQDNKTINADHILFYNQCEGKTHSLILLSSC